MVSALQVVQRRRNRRTQANTGGRRLARWLAGAALVIAGVGFIVFLFSLGAIISAYAYYSQQLPEPNAVSLTPGGANTTTLYDRTGQHVLYEVVDPLGGERAWASLSNIPESLRTATIALVDKSFYENRGSDARGIVGAALTLLAGPGSQGGSSITQKLVENVALSPSDRSGLSSDRRLKETILTARINEKYSKDQILEWYLNTNFYGNLAYGVEAASQVYFGKPVSELTLSESAMLAAIPQSPTMNPIDNFPQSKEGQRLVLDAMVAQGYITTEQADIAFAAPLDIKPTEQRLDLSAPHFAIAARKQLESMFGPDLVYRGGLVVYTTLDYPLYLQAECVTRTHMARLSGQPFDTVVPAEDGSPCTAASYLMPLNTRDQNMDHHADNASVVIIEARTGEILAMVGSLDYYNTAIDGAVNMATADRQPGSTIMPFAYLAAFQQGFTPATMTLDVQPPPSTDNNQPLVRENSDGQFHGPVSLRTALANSYEVSTAQVINWVGMNNIIRVAHAMGMNTLNGDLQSYGPDLTLGGGDATLTDMAYAFSVLANQGVMNGNPTPQEARRPGFRALDPTLILRVEDQAGNILWEYGKGNTYDNAAVTESSLAYLVTDILSDNEARHPSAGADSALTLDRPAAITAGATTDKRDSWAIGYTPQLVMGVWVGNTDNSVMVDMPADTGAAPIWQAIMRYAHLSLPVEPWQRPPDIVEVTVCKPSGLLPTPYCPTYQELFRRGTEPTSPDDIYKQIAINKDTGLLATVYTPANLVEQRIYEALPSEAAGWAREAGIPQPPTTYDSLPVQSPTGDVSIIEPSAFSYVRGSVQINGNARDANFQSYRLDYGSGLNPAQWYQIGADSNQSISNGLLGLWDTSALDGLYSLRLTVIRGDSSFQQSVIQVTVDNIAPTFQGIRPNDRQHFSLSDEYLTIQPNVDDNVSMDRVEFYVDGALIATSKTAPFNARWVFTEAGSHIIEIRAYDTAGNVTISQPVNIVVTP